MSDAETPPEWLSHQALRAQARLLEGYCEHAEMPLPEDLGRRVQLFERTRRNVGELLEIEEGRLALSAVMRQNWVLTDDGPELQFTTLGQKMFERIHTAVQNGSNLDRAITTMASKHDVKRSVVTGALQHTWRRLGALQAEHWAASPRSSTLIGYLKVKMADQIAPRPVDMLEHEGPLDLEKAFAVLSLRDREFLGRMCGLADGMPKRISDLVSERVTLEEVRFGVSGALNRLRTANHSAYLTVLTLLGAVK